LTLTMPSPGHAAVVVTECEEIRALDLKRAAALMEAPKVLVDGRNVLDLGEVRVAGIRYRGFGQV
jgi:UDPglucose 6-dehydrogenase